MKLPRRFSLRFLLMAIAVIAGIVALATYRAQRGWTVANVERLISAEFKPEWGREQTEQWIQSHRFGELTAMTDSTVPGGATLAAYIGLHSDVAFVVRGLITPDLGANVGGAC
jgi:hypothetical protein